MTWENQPRPLPPVPQTSTMAIVSLVAGVLGWIGVLGIGPLVAIITGHMAKSEIRKNPGQLGGDGLATAGLVLGYLNLALTVLVLCLVILLPLLGFGGLALCAPFIDGSNIR